MYINTHGTSIVFFVRVYTTVMVWSDCRKRTLGLLVLSFVSLNVLMLTLDKLMLVLVISLCLDHHSIYGASKQQHV